ncbi:lysophospholipid acyltransferase family protein [Nesterenkonia populi]
MIPYVGENAAAAEGKARRSPAWRFAAGIVRPGMNVLMGKDWQGLEKIPSDGCIVVANHVSAVDPLAVLHAVYRSGTTPHIMAKESLFRVPVLGALMRKVQLIPVARGDREKSQQSFEAAYEIIQQGGAVVIYPEGTLTKDPGLWPMRMKTGAARLALITGAPVIPLSHWGTHRFLPRGKKLPRILPRRRYSLRADKPVDLSDLRGRPLSRTLLAEATQRIEQALTDGVAELRGEPAPELIWDRNIHQRVPRDQLRARAEQAENEAGKKAKEED